MSDFAGTFDESTEGEELAHVIVEHWRISAGSTVFIDEIIQACKTTGVPIGTVESLIKAMNDYRGHDFDTDVLNHAFVPRERIGAVCALLDAIQGLCVRC